MLEGYSTKLNKSSALNFEQTPGPVACLNLPMPAPQPELFEIAKRLIDTREALGFVGWGKQGEFADAAGLARNRYNQWERGRVRPPEKGLHLLWDRFGIPPEWIWYAQPHRLPYDLATKLKLPARPKPTGRNSKVAASH